MKKVFVCTDTVSTRLNPYGISIFNRLMHSARKSGITLVSNPDDSDIIIFCEPRDYFQTNLLRSGFYEKYRTKTVVFSQQDSSIPRIPGIYNRIPSEYHDAGIYEYGFYLKVFDFIALDEIDPKDERRYLYSFVGNGKACPEVRQKILSLMRENALLLDTQVAFGDTSGRYAQSMAASFFVLAPRGLGPSSFRLFEAMRAGRVPVIISDEWRPISGIDWNDFAILVRQTDIDSIPDILESNKRHAIEMGVEARRVYAQYFSIDSAFSWLVNTSNRLLSDLEGNSKYVFRSLFPESFRYGLIKSSLSEILTNQLSRNPEIRITAHS